MKKCFTLAEDALHTDGCTGVTRVQASCAKRTEKNFSPFTFHFSREGKRYAFTLAEVLITLGIIGVVAAITLPTLIEHHQKTVTVNSLKKMYSVLNQAAHMYQADNGVLFEEFDTSLDDKIFMEIYLLPYIQTIKECDDAKVCYGNSVPLGINRKTNITPKKYLWVMKDGSFLGITNIVSGKTFYFDINGAKGPNYAGRDIFYFYLVNANTIQETNVCPSYLASLKSGIYPGGYASCYVPHASFSRTDLLSTEMHRSCNRATTHLDSYGGDACAALIMVDGWKISDEYPW